MNLPLNHRKIKTRRSTHTFAPPWLRRGILWFLPLAFLIIFFFAPLSKILALTFDFDAFTPQNLQIIWRAVRFTFYQAFLSTILTLLLGLPAAYLFARYDFPGKSVLRALTAIPFMLPTVVVAATFNAVFGQRGWVNSIIHPLTFTLDPFMAILLAHIFYNSIIVIRLVGNALSSLDPKLEQAARSLGADTLQVWRHLTLPIIRPAIFASSLLVFLFDFTSFGVILLLGASKFSTLEVEIYLRVMKLPNLSLAALLSIIQLICTVVVSMIYSRVVVRSTTPTAPRSAASNLRMPKTIREKTMVASFILFLCIFFLLPLVSLPIRSLVRLEADRGERGEVQYGFTPDYYTELFINRRGSVFYTPPIQAVLNSLTYASATVALSLLLGIPAAFALAKPTKFERVLDPLIMLPLGSSAVMLGLGFIILYGRWLAAPLLVPFAHTLVALPFVIRALQPAIVSIPQRLRHAASSLGASPLDVWRHIDLPILRRATIAAAVFAFTISLGEFGATLLIARPEYPTIPIAIDRFLSQPGGLNYGQAMATATILMLLTTAGILVIERFRLPGAGEF
jgi:thiamine transport system permease protein